MVAGKGRDEMLGFGVEVALATLTPVALSVAREVIAFVSAEVAREAKEESAPVVREAVRRLFRRQRRGPEGGGTPKAELTGAQLGAVHRIALEKALQLQLPRDQAELLADAMAGDLATAAGD